MSTMTLIADNARVMVPGRVLDPMTLDEFREWAGNDDLPEKCVVYYHRGEWGVDVSKEQIFTHSAVKTEFAAILRYHANGLDLGEYYANGVLLVNRVAKLSCNPDGLFASYETFRTKTLVALEGKQSGHVELHGTPDMVLEVVSVSTIHKDNELLLKAYWEAGIPEYWLVDARFEEPSFRILKRGPKGYTDIRKANGWLKSALFDASFKLVRSLDPNGMPRFRLEIKS